LYAALAFAATAKADPNPDSGQQTTPAQPPPDANATRQPSQGSQTTGPESNTEHEQQTGTSNDRLFFALPNFLTIQNASDVPPLSSKEKFTVVARSAFDYTEFAWYAAIAGISQAENSEPEYGQGLIGYSKRYGTAFADGTIENFWVSAIVPSVLHQDPRFYQKSDGGFASRATYAATRMFITRSDSGHKRFNASEIFGSMAAALISTYAYHPRQERNIGNAASVWGSEIGYDTVTIEIKEFWPDIHRVFSHKAPQSQPSQQQNP
jgi:hypothetical protein